MVFVMEGVLDVRKTTMKMDSLVPMMVIVTMDFAYHKLDNVG